MKWKAIYLALLMILMPMTGFLSEENEVSDEMSVLEGTSNMQMTRGTTPRLHPLFSDGHVYDWIECTGQWFDNVSRPCTHAHPADIIFTVG